jgi:hypothetical protein
LAEVALDGLPRRVAQRQSPTFAEYVDEFWRDCAHHWKPSTQKRNWDAIRLDITPQFGPMRLDIICRSDIIRWRDDCAEEAGEVQPRAAGAGGDAEICRSAGVSAQGAIPAGEHRASSARRWSGFSARRSIGGLGWR